MVSGAVCKGSWALGTACGDKRCGRCRSSLVMAFGYVLNKIAERASRVRSAAEPDAFLRAELLGRFHAGQLIYRLPLSNEPLQIDRFTYPTVERLAVVYGDGSVSVAPNLEAENLPAMIEICTLHNQTASSSNRLHWARARVARVRVEVVEFIAPPAPDLGAVKAQITVGTDGDANMVRSILGDKAQFFDIAVRARPRES